MRKTEVSTHVFKSLCSDEDGNHVQLLNLRAHDSPDLEKYLQGSTNFIFGQEEMMRMFSHSILCSLASK